MNLWWRNIIDPGSPFSKVNSYKKKGVGMKGKKVALTKVTRPRLQPVYHRTELYNLLDELSAKPLIMVNGMSGSGKTTLMSSYIESRDVPCLWYQMDKDDADLATFFYYLSLALLRVNPYNKITLPHISPERVFNVPALAREYFRKLYQCFETPFMVVFDDYHLLPGEAALHGVLAEACAVLPPGGRIALISNSDCQTYVGLKSQCVSATLGCEELQLSQDEVKQVAALHGVSLHSDQAAKQLQMKVGGWIAGLVHELSRERSSSLTSC